MDKLHPDSDIEKLRDLINDIDIAMLTTQHVSGHGKLHSRPMATQELDAEGNLWFFTDATSLKISEVFSENQVNVAYADSKSQKYISVSGAATLVHDQDKIEQLWKPIYKAWFPKGLNDPKLALLKVQVESAEYWDSPHAVVVKLVNFAKSMINGHPDYSESEHGKISFRPLF